MGMLAWDPHGQALMQLSSAAALTAPLVLRWQLTVPGTAGLG